MTKLANIFLLVEFGKPNGKEEKAMLTRKELESLLSTRLTDEQWADTCKMLSDIEEKMWEEDHPLDD